MPKTNTTYHRFRLVFQSAWNLGTETTKNWSINFSVSGTIQMNDADAEATALALAKPALQLASTTTSLISYSYYPSGTLVASSTKDYTPGTHPGDGTAYSAGVGQEQQLEVTILARAPVGKNVKGKPTYLRHYLHDIRCGPSGANTIGPISNPSLILTPWNSGAGPHNVVPVSPSTGAQGGPWVFEQHLYTHQMRKGKKKKKVTASAGTDILGLLDSLGKAAGVGLALGELLPIP